MTQKRAARTVRRVPPPLTRSPGHRMLPCAEVLAESVESNAPGVLLDLAHGAAGLGESKRAERAARKALELAAVRKQEKVIVEAEALISALTAGNHVAMVQEVPAATSQYLAARFVEVLQSPRAITQTS